MDGDCCILKFFWRSVSGQHRCVFRVKALFSSAGAAHCGRGLKRTILHVKVSWRFALSPRQSCYTTVAASKSEIASHLLLTDLDLLPILEGLETVEIFATRKKTFIAVIAYQIHVPQWCYGYTDFLLTSPQDWLLVVWRSGVQHRLQWQEWNDQEICTRKKHKPLNKI